MAGYQQSAVDQQSAVGQHSAVDQQQPWIARETADEAFASLPPF
jgi:hypothetical protein